ncbi:MAG: twin-arginine translocase TatA/TatE family subunit [Miltoncostaeaceae bacterium]
MDDRHGRSHHREAWAIGPTEIIIVLVIVLLLFGAKRIPEIARSLGSGAREFKEGVQGKDAPEDSIDEHIQDSDERDRK